MLPESVQIIGGRPQLSAGALRHTITIQSEVAGAGYTPAGSARARATVTTAKASISSPSGGDTTMGGQTVTELVQLVAIWWQASVRPNMFVVLDSGLQYKVESIENVLEMNLVLVLNCKAIGANS